jgi:hypothetical protein
MYNKKIDGMVLQRYVFEFNFKLCIVHKKHEI